MYVRSQEQVQSPDSIFPYFKIILLLDTKVLQKAVDKIPTPLLGDTKLLEVLPPELYSVFHKL